MATASPVYDPETEKGPHHDAASADELENLFNRPSTPEQDAEAAEREKNAIAKLNGGGDSSSSNLGETALAGAALGGTPLGRLNRIRALLSNNRRRASGAGAVAVIGVVMFLLSLALIPLKIEHVVKNLENRFYASAKNAVGKETDNALRNYMSKKIGPALAQGRCKNYVSKDCTVNFGFDNGKNPVTNLYKTWKQAKVENILSKDYGIELRFDKKTRTYHLKAPGINGEENLGDEAHLDDGFRKADRGEVRTAFRNAEKGMTKFDKIMFRYKAGRLLEEKYGIKRCLIFCGARDALSNKKDSLLGGITQRKAAAKIYLVQRVIVPYDAARGIALACILSTSCDPVKSSSSPVPEGATNELNGFPENPESDTALRESFTALAGTYGGSVDDAIKEYGKIKDKGAAKYLVQTVLEKVGLGEISSQVTDVIPVIGWVNKGSQIIVKLDTIGPTVKKLSYITVAAGAVQIFSMYQTYADEVHTGHVNIDELGSMVGSLGPGSAGTSSDPQVGGTADASATPLYANLMNSSGTAPSTSDNAKNFPNYKCKDGKPVPNGSTVCPEEQLGGGSALANSIHNALHDDPIISGLTAVAHAIQNPVVKAAMYIGSGVASALFDLIKLIPGVGSIVNSVSTLVGNLVSPFFTWVLNELIVNPISSYMSGGRTFDMMAAGADVSGNDYANIGLGGKQLSPQSVAAQYNEQQYLDQQDFRHQSMFARVFSTSSDYSLVSKLAVATPYNLQASTSSAFASFLTNPFGIFKDGFASLLTPKASAAGVSAQPDPFNVTQYGYDDSDIPSDPEAYWDQNCANGKDTALLNARNASAASTLDPNTEMPVNKSVDSCLLIKSMVGSAGGLFDTSLLSADDLADVNGSSSNAGVSSGGCGGTGQYSALVGPGSTFAGTDQGIDFSASSSKGFDICAPASGTITEADQTGHVFARTNGAAEIIEKLDTAPSVPGGKSSNSSQYIYYAETINIGSGIKVGTHVNKGDVIGHSPNTSIEVGWALSPTIGFMCTLDPNNLGAPTPCGETFGAWIQSLSTGAAR